MADVVVTRHEVAERTRLVLDRLEATRRGARAELMHDTCAVIAAWDDVELRLVDDASDEACSVAGGYTWSPSTGAVISVARSRSRGREAFTALHELGHHLQRSDPVLSDALVDDGTRAKVMEELVCDSFAGAVLIPDDVVEQHIGPEGPTVADVVALHDATEASRSAVCVRASERLRSPGHVVLLDRYGRVRFAASRGLPPLRRGGDQGSIPVVDEVLGSYGGTRSGRTRFLYRGAVAGDELYVQAGDLDGYVVAVAVLDRPPWQDGFVLPAVETGPEPGRWVCENEACGEEFESFDAPCVKCRLPSCPECGRCGCKIAASERKCESCHLVYPARMFASGSQVCESCF